MKEKPVIGYTSGVFDLFHIGHLNVLRNAKSMCDFLVVGVSTDELVFKYKNKKPIIPFLERCEILQHIEFTNAVIAQDSMDKIELWEKIKFNTLFVGDDWHGTPKWQGIEKELQTRGVNVVYFPYTKTTSSTKINKVLDTYR